MIRYLKKPNKVVANRRKDEKRLLVAFIGIICLLAVILIYFYPKSAPSKSVMYREGRAFIKTTVRHSLARMGLKEINLANDNPKELILAFEIPQQMSNDQVIETIKPIIQRKGCVIRSVNRFTQARGFAVVIDYYNQPIGTISFLKGRNLEEYQILKGELRRKPKLAIIIDDFGYGNNAVIKEFIQFNTKLTISVIPGHRYSRWTSSEGKKNGKEIIVHMPMQPERSEYGTGEDQYLIRQTMRSFEIEQRIAAALMELPEAVGMSNHMGSLATTDADVMGAVISSLKKRGLYFIDSLTSPRSVAYEVARVQGIPAGIRSVFLDNNRDKSEIQAQFKKAIAIARRRGSAIAIGHVHLETLQVLRQLIEAGQFEGIMLCFASEIVS
ncbi:MAG: divergent polysaccharide deacetylase family protein [Candidatus Marinimicrobia bacterium]|nr:divergent polysaccharide deacetylase family protein [Candidatus Neomarinimicrobiota bacterium]